MEKNRIVKSLELKATNYDHENANMGSQYYVSRLRVDGRGC